MKATIELILPLLRKTAGAYHKASLQIAASDEFLDEQASHDCLASPRVIGYLGRQALKLFKMAGLSGEEVQEMLAEAVLLSQIDHPNIVRVFDANTIDLSGQVFGYFTMEHVAGGSLDRFWRSHGTQFVAVPVVVDLIKQVCRGLATAHKQDPPIIHRDIKPQNILVGYQSDGLRAKVSDFGLAKKVNPLTLLASARGTRAFKAPEAFEDFNSDSCSGDVWAVGMTLYLLLTDKLPFVVPDDEPSPNAKVFAGTLIPPSRVNPLCDPRLDQIVVRSLAVDRAKRYSSAIELLADLESWAPKLQTASGTSSNQLWSTSKEVLGHVRRIDDAHFRAHFGHDHHFAIKHVTIVGGRPHFGYGGYNFEIVDAWPHGWSYNDNCYIDFVDGGYYLFNLRHPGVRISVGIL